MLHKQLCHNRAKQLWESNTSFAADCVLRLVTTPSVKDNPSTLHKSPHDQHGTR